jgi:hypothetical protein
MPAVYLVLAPALGIQDASWRQDSTWCYSGHRHAASKRHIVFDLFYLSFTTALREQLMIAIPDLR